MQKIIAFNGSPDVNGSTSKLLSIFLEGAAKAGAQIENLHLNDFNIQTCKGEMFCWYKHPGKCFQTDDMQVLYEKLKESNVLIIATPVYIPLPGKMQIFLNRLCPLIYPLLEFESGRTHARFYESVNIEKILLLSVGGWWEIENLGILTQIIKEIAVKTNMDFAGAIQRPHAFLMWKDGELTEQGNKVAKGLFDLGEGFIRDGYLDSEKQKIVSTPLITSEALINRYNQAVT